MTAPVEPVCLVTGSGRGIGAAVAQLAGRRGYRVCVNYLTAKAEAEHIATSLRADGMHAIAVRADVSREDDVAVLFEKIDREFGPVTALVNNAAISGGRQDFAGVDVKLLRQVLDVNLLGTFFCTKFAFERMAKSKGGAGGAVVNLSTTATRTGGFRLSPYVTSKAAVEGLTRSLAVEFASEGIRVNAVSPGIIETAQQPLENVDWRARTAATIPLGRLGTPDEVAQAIVWLLSPAASYVTGTIVDVAGGR